MLVIHEIVHYKKRENQLKSKIVATYTNTKSRDSNIKKSKRDININGLILETQTANSQTVETQKLRIKSQHNLQ